MRNNIKPIAMSGLLGAVSLVAIQGQAASAQVSETTLASFEIESQPLAKALMKYSEQSQIVIVAPTDLVKGKMSSPVGGYLDPGIALDQLLMGTGLALQPGNNGALTLKASAEMAEEKDAPRPFAVGAPYTSSFCSPE